MFPEFVEELQGSDVMTFQFDQTSTVAVDRRTLYEQIWKIPAAKLAIQYGISDVGLAKACKRHKIPRPPRGYWAKIEAGQKIKRTPLPTIKNPAYDTVIMRGWDLPNEALQRIVVESALPRPKKAGVEAAPQQLHPILEVTRASLLLAKPDLEGLVSSDPGSAFSVQIAPTSLDRCMSILDRFMRAFESRGGEIRIAEKGNDDHPFTMVAIGPDGFAIEVVEGVDESKPVTDPQRLTGKLHLYINGDEDLQQFRRRWSETKSQRLERMINPLVDTLVNAIEVQKQQRLDAECVERQKERVNRLRRAAAQQHDEDFNWRQQLSRDANRWHEARRIREYLEAIIAALEAKQVKPRDAATFAEWFEWARAYADSIDPIRQEVVPVQTVVGPTNTPVAELDLTTAARTLIANLGVRDSDELLRKRENEFRQACSKNASSLWNEVTRVLEGLGYDISKRQVAQY